MVTVRRVVLAGAGWLMAYAIATALAASHPGAQRALSDVAYHLPLVVAAVAAFAAGRRLTGYMRRFWLGVAASVTLMAIGELIWSFHELVLSTEAPVPSLADAFYLASVVVALPAVFLGFGGTTRSRRDRAWLDAVIVVTGFGVLGWRMLIAPQLNGGFSFAVATQIAYPLLDIAVIVVLISVGFAGHRRVPMPVMIVGAAYGVAAIGDAFYSYLTTHGLYDSGSWLDLTWQLQFVLIAVAAVVAIRVGSPDAERQLRDRDLGQWPVLLGVVLALIVAVSDLASARSMATVWAVGMAVLGLLYRHQLTLNDLHESSRALNEILAEQQRLATTDVLTSLYNRRFVVDAIESALADRRANDGPVGLLELDLDHFKQINDVHGHACGDQVLAEVARRLDACTRAGDIVARYGGEEFVVLLRGATGDSLIEIAERYRAAVSERTISLADGSEITPTVSIGASESTPGRATLEQLLAVADAALYEAKAAGRDRVVVGASAPVLA